MIEDAAHWPSGAVRIVWHGPEGTELPVTGAHGFCFYEGQVLVCDISGRGLTIPGGHLNAGESAANCLTREASEEACVELANLKLLGFIEADHRANKEFDGRYPLRSVQAIYRADVSAVREFDSRHESVDRQFVATGELRSHHHEWNAVLEEALKTKAGYIGMIGSKRKRNQVYDHLREKGFTEEDFKRVMASDARQYRQFTAAKIELARLN
jgi:8-oxo-dGTP diphosphatase